MSKKSQPRLTDLTLNTISAGHSPTPVYLLEPETESLCLLPTKTKKQKKERQKQNNLHQCNTGRKETPTSLMAWRQNPGPNGQGKTEPKKQRREEEV